MILVVLGFFISNLYETNLPNNNLYTLAIAIIMSQILQLIANLRHKAVHKSSNLFTSKAFRWATFSILVAMSSIPFFTIIDNETKIAYLFRLSSGVFLFIFFILLYIQPDQAIYPNGILTKGAFWSWKDIEGFKISGSNLDKSLLPIAFPNKDFLYEIVFFIKKMPFGGPKKIHFYIAESQINILSIFLEQNIKKIQ
jgi:CDP-diglyceride synthetase